MKDLGVNMMILIYKFQEFEKILKIFHLNRRFNTFMKSKFNIKNLLMLELYLRIILQKMKIYLIHQLNHSKKHKLNFKLFEKKEGDENDNVL